MTNTPVASTYFQFFSGLRKYSFVRVGLSSCHSLISKLRLMFALQKRLKTHFQRLFELPCRFTCESQLAVARKRIHANLMFPPGSVDRFINHFIINIISTNPETHLRKFSRKLLQFMGINGLLHD